MPSRHRPGPCFFIYPISDIINLQFDYLTDFYGDWERMIEIYPLTVPIIIAIIILGIAWAVHIVRDGLYEEISI